MREKQIQNVDKHTDINQLNIKCIWIDKEITKEMKYF